MTDALSDPGSINVEFDQIIRDPGSFRDPSGFVFKYGDSIYRQINHLYKNDYDLMMSSGLYENLARDSLMVDHVEIQNSSFDTPEAYRVIRPQKIAHISYPSEWSFSQYRDAALLTLEVQRRALEHGMSLKDASAYNIQFIGCRPIFIDTLSFEKFEGQAWSGYRQFCQHFMAPLLLMARRDIRLGLLMNNEIDGIPLDLASKLLPKTTKFRPLIALHIHWHARMQQKHAHTKAQIAPSQKSAGLSKSAALGLISSLESLVKAQNWQTEETEWGNYYDNTNYSDTSFSAKQKLVEQLINDINGPISFGVDLGSNTGVFSRLAAARCSQVLSIDGDYAAVEQNYLSHKKDSALSDRMLPLRVDLASPTPGFGWDNAERIPVLKRLQADLIMALALIHHLAISNNLPFDHIATLLRDLGQWLVIEFVPKEDSQVKRLLANRKDIFPNYNIENFESSMAQYFATIKKIAIPDTVRHLYLMRRLDS